MWRLSEEYSCSDIDTRLERQIKEKLLEIIAGSPLPEDYKHARNTLYWVMRLYPQASEPLRIAALAHDIERAFPERKVQRSHYPAYDQFKEAHALNSARIATEVLQEFPLNQEFIERCGRLIAQHEYGNAHDREAEVLKIADSISFFEVNLPYYFLREGEMETLKRMQWGLRRLPEDQRHLLLDFDYENQELKRLLKKALNSI